MNRTIPRRTLLKQLGALAGVSLLPLKTVGAGARREAAFASAFSDLEGRHYVGILDAAGRLLSRQPVPSRGHAAAVSADGQLLAFFARRPRRWLVVLDLASGEPVAQVESRPGRHFYGHGLFSADSRLLLTTENDYDNVRGVIGVYDARDRFKRIGELPSFGVGPHEMAMLADGRTLVVANGGIQTHPDYGRIKLNLESMSPALTYIDLEREEELASHAPPHHQLSLRHLDVNAEDTVVVGAQYQGSDRQDLPLVFRHRQGGALEPMRGQPGRNQQRLNQYIASVTFAPDGRRVVTSAPRGNRVSVWDAQSATWVRDLSAPDIGGVSPGPGSKGMVLSSGTGRLYRLEDPGEEYSLFHAHQAIQWDNHLVPLV